AEHYPNMDIVSVSNSAGHLAHIESMCAERGYTNVHVITADINGFDPAEHDQGKPFDRAVSIEMFEHMRNYKELLRRVSTWLKLDGLLFVHIFAHPTLAYPYEVRSAKDWMTQYFFAGGVMPSQHLLMHFQDDMAIEDHWWVNGQHYEKTSNHWLAIMDAERPRITELFAQAYGADDAKLWVQRWRMFYMAVAEFFGYDNGQEWGVGHYLFKPRAAAGATNATARPAVESA
ncbi:methyltransferase domain-containing protein, partial [bacterium]|nr:methyltransferase domain-containing protein [bacterium]